MCNYWIKSRLRVQPNGWYWKCLASNILCHRLFKPPTKCQGCTIRNGNGIHNIKKGVFIISWIKAWVFLNRTRDILNIFSRSFCAKQKYLEIQNIANAKHHLLLYRLIECWQLEKSTVSYFLWGLIIMYSTYTHKSRLHLCFHLSN